QLQVANLALEQRPDGTFGAFLFGFDYNPDDYQLVTKDGLRYRYNQFAGLQLIKDLSGNTLTFTTDGIFSSSGEQVLFTRDGAGRITAITDPGGKQIRYGYDAQGNLIAVTDQANLTTTFT